MLFILRALFNEIWGMRQTFVFFWWFISSIRSKREELTSLFCRAAKMVPKRYRTFLFARIDCRCLNDRVEQLEWRGSERKDLSPRSLWRRYFKRDWRYEKPLSSSDLRQARSRYWRCFKRTTQVLCSMRMIILSACVLRIRHYYVSRLVCIWEETGWRKRENGWKDSQNEI